MDHATTDPQSYPHLKIACKDVEIKLRSFDVIQLNKDGIDIGASAANLGANLERAFAILHQAIAHEFEETPDACPTAEALSKMDLGDSADVVKAVNDSISKAMAQWKTAFPDKPKDEKPPTIQ